VALIEPYNKSNAIMFPSTLIKKKISLVYSKVKGLLESCRHHDNHELPPPAPDIDNEPIYRGYVG
jgi:hypothetical protein